MKRTIAVAAGFVAIAALGIAPAQAAEEAPTFNGEVGQILLDNCASCHRPNQVAPMSLLSYRDARPWARAIKSKVVSREMPPWFADPRFGTFSNDISLSDDEIGTIVAWVDGGAPQGDGPAPAPPDFSAAGWSHPDGLDPDYVIEFPIAWRIDAEGETPNFNLFTPLPFDDVMRVSATEVRPGNYAVTHHITTGLVDLPPGTKLGRGPAWPGGPLVDYVPVEDPDAAPVEDEAEEDEAEVEERSAEELEERRRARGGFGPYIPGVGARVVRDGQIREVRGDLFDYIIWNLHYQATGKPETSRPSIGAWLATEERSQRVRSLSLNETTSENEQLVAPPPLTPEERRARAASRQVGQGLNPLLAPIPPNDGNWTVTGIGGFQNDAVIQSMFVHAHVRGKDFTWVLTYPDGREEILLRVPNYDFDWQFEYELAEPIRVPAGTTVKSIARYDNSRNNRRNPAPHKEVYWSEQSWDDMYLTNVNYTLVDETPADDD
jgi:mono/diheme cytochrome c family protein